MRLRTVYAESCSVLGDRTDLPVRFAKTSRPPYSFREKRTAIRVYNARDYRNHLMSLFADAADRRLRRQAPLAARLRPRTLDEVVGQQHLVAPGAPFGAT